MKRQLLIQVFIAIAAISKGQTFAPIGAKWYYTSHGNGAGLGYYLYESVLDTVVAGRSCKKIAISFYQYNNTITYPSPVFINQKSDTVFYYNQIYSRYFPLYIFNVSQGDTLTFHSPTVPIYPADTLWKSVIDSVTNFIVGADTLQRVWTTEPNVNAFSFWGGYIELLGSPFLMLQQPHIIYPEWDGPLRCYSDSSVSYNCTGLPCNHRSTTGFSEISQELGFTIFPNPANSFLTIKMADNSFTRYKIYNLLGQPILSGQLISTTTIPLDNFRQGMYVIELTTNNYARQQRLIVNK